MFIAAETGSSSLNETARSTNREDTVFQLRVAVGRQPWRPGSNTRPGVRTAGNRTQDCCRQIFKWVRYTDGQASMKEQYPMLAEYLPCTGHTFKCCLLIHLPFIKPIWDGYCYFIHLTGEKSQVFKTSSWRSEGQNKVMWPESLCFSTAGSTSVAGEGQWVDSHSLDDSLFLLLHVFRSIFWLEG